MSNLCNKCRQSEAYQGDSWCLGCSSLEALGVELKENWGVAGSRAVATDLLTSVVRQVRALRRLGNSTAGETRAGLSSWWLAVLHQRKEVKNPQSLCFLLPDILCLHHPCRHLDLRQRLKKRARKVRVKAKEFLHQPLPLR